MWTLAIETGGYGPAGRAHRDLDPEDAGPSGPIVGGAECAKRPSKNGGEAERRTEEGGAAWGRVDRGLRKPCGAWCVANVRPNAIRPASFGVSEPYGARPGNEALSVQLPANLATGSDGLQFFENKWRARRDSNPRPTGSKPAALSWLSYGRNASPIIPAAAEEHPLPGTVG